MNDLEADLKIEGDSRERLLGGKLDMDPYCLGPSWSASLCPWTSTSLAVGGRSELEYFKVEHPKHWRGAEVGSPQQRILSEGT